MTKNAVLDVGTKKHVATEEDQEPLNYLEDSISTKKLVASGISEIEDSDKNWVTQSPYFNRLHIAHGQSFLDCETKIWS